MGISSYTGNGGLGGESELRYKILYGFKGDFKTSLKSKNKLLLPVSMLLRGVLSFGTPIARYISSFPPFVKILNEQVFQGIPGP